MQSRVTGCCRTVEFIDHSAFKCCPFAISCAIMLKRLNITSICAGCIAWIPIEIPEFCQKYCHEASPSRDHFNDEQVHYDVFYTFFLALSSQTDFRSMQNGSSIGKYSIRFQHVEGEIQK
jgi:hypothetical protein